MIEITSTTNPLVKRIKSYNQKKYRDQDGLFIIEGIKNIEEALKSGAKIDTLIISKKLLDSSDVYSIIERIEKQGALVQYVNDAVLESISDTKTPQGILATVSKLEYQLNDFMDKEDKFILLIENIQDPGNLGTIIRTADAAGIDGIIIVGNSVDIYNPKVVRSTMGSIFHLPILEIEEIDWVISRLKEKSIRIVATDLNTDSYHWGIDYRGDLCIAVGNEAKGISDKLRGQADILVKIPILGKAESLNVATAAGIMLYQGVAKRT